MKNFIMVEKDLLARGLKGNSLNLFLMLMDRSALSEKNGWIDEKCGSVYIIMTIKEICQKLGVCKRTATSILGSLEVAHLISRKKQGLGKPQRIFVTYQVTANCASNISQISDTVNTDSAYSHEKQDISLPEESYTDVQQEFYIEWFENYQKEMLEHESEKTADAEILPESIFYSDFNEDNVAKDGSRVMEQVCPSEQKLRFKKCKKLHFQKCKKLPPSNIKYNNTESNICYTNNLSYQDDGERYMTIRHTFLKNIEYDILAKGTVDPMMLSAMADVAADALATCKRYIHVAGQNRKYEDVYNRLMSIDSSHIEYISECINRTTVPVRNPKAYLFACLYNAPATINSYYELQAKIDMNRQTHAL